MQICKIVVYEPALKLHLRKKFRPPKDKNIKSWADFLFPSGSTILGTMNDPHVVALHYRIVVGEHHDFDKAPVLNHSEPLFDVVVDGKVATFVLKQHFASEAEARVVVQPFADAWNVYSGIEKGPGAFELQFDRADIIDRHPRTDRVHVASAVIRMEGGSVQAVGHTRHGQFPAPPSGFVVSSDVAAMYWQYRGYKEGRLALVHMAYFMLTILEKCGGGKPHERRTNAARLFAIERDVLKTIGDLTGDKGGPDARKASGLNAELTPNEQTWLEEVAKMMIRRAGEIAANPTGPYEKITPAHLPPL